MPRLPQPPPSECEVCGTRSEKIIKSQVRAGEKCRWMCSECVRWRNIEQCYGLRKEDYERLLQSQNESCAICQTHITQLKPGWKNGTKRLVVDHCHQTNTVRGLLCTHCNNVVAFLGESAQHLERLRAYLLMCEEVRSQRDMPAQKDT